MRKCCRVCPGWRDEIQLGEFCSSIPCNVGKKKNLLEKETRTFHIKTKHLTCQALGRLACFILTELIFEVAFCLKVMTHEEEQEMQFD